MTTTKRLRSAHIFRGMPTVIANEPNKRYEYGYLLYECDNLLDANAKNVTALSETIVCVVRVIGV